MASSAQVTANQANAQSSTGPRTPEGKAHVSQNALSHGLTARHLVIRPEEHQEFSALQDSLIAELDPQGAVETVTFHELLHSAWSLHRFRRIEAECSSGSPADFSEPSITTVLDRVGRYQARAQRAYYKALQELRTLQTNRALRSFKLDENDEPEVPAITDINELTKQTHSEVTAEAIKQAINIVEYQNGVLQLNALQNHKARTTPASSSAPSNTAPGKAPAAPSC
ncbi:MAG TPA: hypothetical protein VGZ73_09335 [Bryobacteraceae bacterium]|jgi:hypothetical protein|nr:hypothetical protein [Bryobacteraceae bacterium]